MKKIKEMKIYNSTYIHTYQIYPIHCSSILEIKIHSVSTFLSQNRSFKEQAYRSVVIVK